MDRVFVTYGATGHSSEAREKNDYYATDPQAVYKLFEDTNIADDLTNNILEPFCGEGHISKALMSLGYNVTSSDLIDRYFGIVQDAFEIKEWNGDIITNPPYKMAIEALTHCLNIVPNGRHVIMLLKLTFLESNKRRALFDSKQLKTLYVSTNRIKCVKNGDFETHKTSAIAYGWYDFVKGYNEDPVIKWFN